MCCSGREPHAAAASLAVATNHATHITDRVVYGIQCIPIDSTVSALKGSKAGGSAPAPRHHRYHRFGEQQQHIGDYGTSCQLPLPSLDNESPISDVSWVVIRPIKETLPAQRLALFQRLLLSLCSG